MQKAVIIGNYGATNLGDETILENILKHHPEIDFTVFSHNPSETQQKHKVKSTYSLPFGLHSILRGNTHHSLKALHQADFVIIGGGGLFTDEKIKAVLLWSWHFFWAKHYQKPVFFYANSIGPLKTKIGKWLTKKVFQKANFITVRDSESAEYLKQWKIKNYKITADPAFLSVTQNLSKYDTSINKSFNKLRIRKRTVAISLRSWIKHEKNYVEILKKITKKQEEKGYQILLISMQSFQDDDRKILEKITTKKSLIISPQNFTELLGILNQCEFTIGMRLHFIIASTLSKTPFIALSYSQKIDSLIKNLAMENYLLPIEKIKTNKLQNLIKNIEKNQKEIKQKLEKNVKSEKEKAEKNILTFAKITG